MSAYDTLCAARERLNALEAASDLLMDARLNLNNAGCSPYAEMLGVMSFDLYDRIDTLAKRIPGLEAESAQERQQEVDYQNREYERSV